MRRGPVGALLLLVLVLAGPAWADHAETVWQALKTPGHVALIRHASAPGTGDPDNFQLTDCATQRNLSAEGRDQARRMGDLFRAAGIAAAEVYTSQWCRCRETAELLDLGSVTDLPAVNSFFRRPSLRTRRTQDTRAWLATQTWDEPVVIVTHFVNIRALTGIAPGSGEIVVVRVGPKGETEPVGRLPTR